jgi:excinuclease ABC subunit B
VTVPAEDFELESIATEEQLRQAIAQLEAQMHEAAKKFEFERAAAIRDRLRALKQRDLGAILSTAPPAHDAGGTVGVPSVLNSERPCDVRQARPRTSKKITPR